MPYDPKLAEALNGPHGDAVIRWLCENGHINRDLGENAAKLIEYNFTLHLFHDAGYDIEPVSKGPPPPVEEQGIDEFL